MSAMAQKKASASGKPLRGIAQRLKGKTGRFRGNLSGKRVDFSGRTVISPDPNLAVDQVGVPQRVAMALSYPEPVTQHNLAFLRSCVRNGPDVWPGANFVIQPDGSKRLLRFGDRKKIADRELAPGWLVERHLCDGDWVLFNRQPSLHRVSIMAHRVKVHSHRTFRFNECVCAPYNADFDGDEMNLHVPQTAEARAEASELMSVLANLVTPKSGEPLIAATQDFITATHLLTSKSIFLDAAQFGQLCAMLDDAQLPPQNALPLPPPCVLKPMRLWSGKQLLSVLFMRAAAQQWRKLRFVHVAVAERSYGALAGMQFAQQMDPSDGFVYVRHGELLSGRVGKAAVGSGSKKGVLYALWRQLGAETAARAMNFLAKLASRWLSESGFSIGVDDVTPSEPLRMRKAALVRAGYAQCDVFIEQLRAGKLPPRPGCNMEQSLEVLLNAELSRIREDAGKSCIRELDPSVNSALIMALCGSKGSTINISQMVACVGQQTVSGSRPPDGFVGRALPHFEKGLEARKPAAKGFVENSFFSGMTCTEFFFHTMAGREGLVDTAVKTAETGYMQRRLMKALEDLGVQYDHTVRASDGTVVQFLYGDDGMDPAMMENVTGGGDGDALAVFDPRALLDEVRSASTLHACRMFGVEDSNDVATDGVHPEQQQQQQEHPQSKLREKREPLRPAELREAVAQQLAPLKMRAEDEAQGGSLRNCEERAVSVSKLYSSVCAFWSGKVDALEARLEAVDKETAAFGSEAHEAAVEAALYEHSLSRYELELFVRLMVRKVERAKLEAGSTAGAIAGQSIGEPGTQMTLKTFHFAGVASMNITLGVPRLKEIINASKTISTPIITAELVNTHDAKAARVVKGRVEATTLGQIAKYVKEVYRERECYVAVKLDRDVINKLQLDVDVGRVRSAIVAFSKLKVKSDDVTICGARRDIIRVRPSESATVSKAAAAAAATAGGGANASQLTRQMQALCALVPRVIVAGFGSVERAVINDKGGGNGYNLLVEGDDMRAVMGVAGIDGTRVTCNHVMAVEEALGIEAARQTIMSEIQYTMRSHGMSVDARHMMLLADVMSYRGEILGITRFGIVKMKTSTLMLASFEMTVDHLFDAAVHARRDDIIGVSECIIMGVPIPLGSGLFKVLRNTKREPLPPRRRALLEKNRFMNVNLSV